LIYIKLCFNGYKHVQGTVFADGRLDQVNADMVAAVYGVNVDILQHNGQVVIVPNQ